MLRFIAEIDENASGDLGARWANLASNSIDLLERAQAAWDAPGDELSSARLVLLLCRRHFESGKDVISTGWLRRAERMLDGSDGCALHGRLALMVARGMLRQGASTRVGRMPSEPSRLPVATGIAISRPWGDHDPMGVAREYATLGCAGV
jgi:hypothetical protein